jgi:hypothetical protein
MDGLPREAPTLSIRAGFKGFLECRELALDEESGPGIVGP